MRPADIARLSMPFAEGVNPNSGVAAALGVAVPRWENLESTIFADLRACAPYGVGWLAPHPGTSRRILISDHLYACVSSVSDNLVEAGVHWLEFLDAADHHSDRFANALTFHGGEPVIKSPRSESPLQELTIQLTRLHAAGVVRALSSSLDCLAGVVVAIAAVPTSILRADLNGVRGLLLKMTRPEVGEGEQRQVSFAQKFEALISAAGPAGWLDWTLQFRNMLVHRGRRVEIGQFVPRTPVLYGANGQPVPRVRVVTHLPRDPGRSDVEVLLEADQRNAPVLTEDAEQTLSGVFASTHSLIEAVADELLDFWTWRRQHPDLLVQPAKQWPKGASTASTGFGGYAPGSFNYSPSMMMTHPHVVHRLRAAALDDSARSQWKTFD